MGNFGLLTLLLNLTLYRTILLFFFFFFVEVIGIIKTKPLTNILTIVFYCIVMPN